MKEAVDRIRHAIVEGTLTSEELTARRICAELGKTTSVLYHHWGSLDVFLYDVAQSGFVDLVSRLRGVESLTAGAEVYLRFAVERPVLYQLMFHRAWDWAALRAVRDPRASVGFLLWQGGVERLRALGSTDPETDARVLYAGLHGLASLAISGRANVGDIERSDLDTSILAARRLISRLVPEDSPT
jgi:AcrR family transcriptional regulator